MGKLKLNQKGFGAVEILLLILVIAVIGFGGYWVYSRNKTSSNNSPTTATNTTPSTTNSPTSNTKTIDPYSGWKTYCDASTGSCFRYPSDWGVLSPLDAQGIKAFGQNKAGTISLEYAEPVKGDASLGNFLTKSVDALTTASSSYKVVGGYYITGNIPGYNLVDSSLVSHLSLSAGKTSDVSNNDLYFTNSSNKATLEVHYNNTSGSSSIGTTQANSWFGSADGKTALLIVQSYYTK